MVEGHLRKLYVRYLRSYIDNEINRQRIKLLWFARGYWPLLFLHNVHLLNSIKLIFRFLLIDWNVISAHKPIEISYVCREIFLCRAKNREVILEAGCWHGGSSAKFSIICKMLGYRLLIYDSFQGVEPVEDRSKIRGCHDFSGEYACQQDLVEENIRKYGEINVCIFIGGWFSDTLKEVHHPIKVAYIDCDSAKGTNEVLSGVIPAMVKDGCIFSQDFHIKSVRDLLLNPSTWKRFGYKVPSIKAEVRNLVSIRFFNHCNE
jgi:O-methyltransferase